MNLRRRSLAQECVLILLLAAGPAMLVPWFHPKRATLTWTKPDVTQVDMDEVARWSPVILWVDAREAQAYATEHVPGAVLLNETEWNRLIPGFLAAWQPDLKIVVYCNAHACDASEEVARRLQRELHLANVYVLKGGWDSWKDHHQ